MSTATRTLNPGKAATAARLDLGLLLATLALAGFGLIMVLSASGIMAEQDFGDKYFFFKRQLIFAGAGLAVMFGLISIPRTLIYRLKYVWIALSVVLLILCLSPLGVTVNHASRWIRLGPVNLQPMELVKPALVIYLAWFFAKKQELVKTFSVGFLPPFLVTGVLCALLMLQPDFGGAVFLAFILFLMSLVGGTRFWYLLGAGIMGSGLFWQLVTSSEYRLKRWAAFRDPFSLAQNEGYQLVQSLYAFGSGGTFGTGLGAGKQKLFFLPEAHNDFIMAVVGEELGFVGMSLFFLLILYFIWRAFKVVLAQEDLQDRFTAFGMALIPTLGFLLNLAVVLGAVPPKGVAMPFISYGGTNLMASFICAGLLLNLSRSRS